MRKKDFEYVASILLAYCTPLRFLLSSEQFYVSKDHKFSFFHWAGGALLVSTASCVAFVSVLPSYCSTAPDYARPHSHRPRPRPRERMLPAGTGVHRIQTGTCFPRGTKGRPQPSGFQTEPQGGLH